MKVVINKLDDFGRGITRIDDKICFVENALPNEVVEIEFTKNKKKYCEAKVLNYYETSKERYKICSYQDQCGGCDLIHMSEQYQDKFKEHKANHTFFFESKVEVLKQQSQAYRNKVVFHVKNKKLGFFKKGSNELVEVSKCLLVDEGINQLIPIFQALVKTNDITEIMVRIGNQTKEILVAIKGSLNKYQELLERVDVLFINEKQVSLKSNIISVIGSKKYYVSRDSFFQINQFLTKDLYDTVRYFVQESNSKHLLDLYCGTGTIGIYVSDLVESVLGIEIVNSAIKDANQNKLLNNIENIHFICGDVTDNTNLIDETIDTVIVDPPRSGLNKNVIAKIIAKKVNYIIYVSCDMATLKRDLNLLSEEYHLQSIKCFDMFPNTHHIETVAYLKYKEVK